MQCFVIRNSEDGGTVVAAGDEAHCREFMQELSIKISAKYNAESGIIVTEEYVYELQLGLD